MTLLKTVLCAACAMAFPVFSAHAQSFPTKPVTLVVPFPQGGPTDAMARTLAAEIKDELGQPVVVENRAGAGGNIGSEYVARASADGYTLLFGTSGPLAINVSLYRKINYDPVTSFSPVIYVGYLPNILTVNATVPAKNAKELIAYAKANPGKLSYASSGNGASSHLAGVLFNARTGTDLLHVPYKGTGPALNDLLGGQVSMSFTDVLTAMPYIQAGKLRAIGVTTETRSQALPKVPTLSEQGVDDYDVSVFFGVVAPVGTPQDIIDKINKAFAYALATPRVKQLFASQGLEASKDTSSAQLGRVIVLESRKWKGIVKQSGAQLD